MPRESTIVAAVMGVAKSLGWYPLKIHGGPYQVAGIPDVLCLRTGRAVWMEVKQPGRYPTAIQRKRMDELEKSGGTPCAVVTSKDQARAFLERHST